MSKYPIVHHQDTDLNHMIEVIKAYPLATVISVKNNTPLITGFQPATSDLKIFKI